MSQTAPCQFLDWDTGFFGHRIARVNGTRLDPVFLKAVLDWCQAQQIECLYFLAESNDPQTVWLAQDHDFSLVEIRITLERSLLDWDPETRPRAAEEGVPSATSSRRISPFCKISPAPAMSTRAIISTAISQKKTGSPTMPPGSRKAAPAARILHWQQ